MPVNISGHPGNCNLIIDYIKNFKNVQLNVPENIFHILNCCLVSPFLEMVIPEGNIYKSSFLEQIIQCFVKSKIVAFPDIDDFQTAKHLHKIRLH